MYLIRTENMAAPGRAVDYEARQLRAFELFKAQPGFQWAVQLNSLGFPAKYTNLIHWESREAYMTYTRSEENRGFVQANPQESLTTALRPREAYEDVLEVGNEGQEEAFGNLVDWILNPGQANAVGFEGNRRAFFEIRQQHSKDFVFGKLYRFLGNPNRYLVYTSYRTLEGLREAATVATTVPEVEAWSRAHPTTDYTSTPSVLERYEVVQRV